jgi:hypothetical protein
MAACDPGLLFCQSCRPRSQVSRPRTPYLLGYDPDSGVDRGWEEKLMTIGHPGLRDALRQLCRTEDSACGYGAYYLGSEEPHDIKDTRQVVAAWRFGEGHAWSAVAQLR